MLGEYSNEMDTTVVSVMDANTGLASWRAGREPVARDDSRANHPPSSDPKISCILKCNNKNNNKTTATTRFEGRFSLAVRAIVGLSHAAPTRPF